MTPDQRRRLQLAGAAAARELLAWRDAIAEYGMEVDADLLADGELLASAALRAVLAAAREPTASRWRIDLRIAEVAPDGRGPAVTSHLVLDATPAEMLDDSTAELGREIAAGFRDHAGPAYAAVVERERAGGRA